MAFATEACARPFWSWICVREGHLVEFEAVYDTERAMEKFFNVAGPCFPAKHYMLPALDRVPEIRHLIEREMYFVVHAPRQSGKTIHVVGL